MRRNAGIRTALRIRESALLDADSKVNPLVRFEVHVLGIVHIKTRRVLIDHPCSERFDCTNQIAYYCHP